MRERRVDRVVLHPVAGPLVFLAVAVVVDGVRAVFEHALARAGLTPREAIYVGDNYFADVVGSLRAGLMPVLYDPSLLFPEAECAVIRSFDELHGLLM